MLSKQPTDHTISDFTKKAYIQSKLSSPEKKNMNSYVGDILLLVQIPLALAFTSVHYFLNQLIDFDQTGIDTLLRGGGN